MPSLNIFSSILITSMLLAFFPTTSQAEWSVWTEPLLADKIRPSYNPTQKNTAIRLSGAKQEMVSFLFCMRSTKKPVHKLTPSVKTAFPGIPSENIKFYMVQNVKTEVPTYINESIGDWPDVCVPYRDRFYGEVRNSTEQGWGKTIPTAHTQLFLVEIYIPVETEPGSYVGTLQLTGKQSPGKTLQQELIVQLIVQNFAIPISWTYGSTFGLDLYPSKSDGVLQAFGKKKWNIVSDMLAKSSSDHGIWLYGAAPYMSAQYKSTDGSAMFTGSFSDSNYGWKRWLDGKVENNPYNPRPYLGVRPAAFEVRPQQGSVWFFASSSKQVDKYFDDWHEFIESHRYGQYTKFYGKSVDELPAPLCCDSAAKYLADAMADGSRDHIFVGQTVGPKECTPRGCSALNDVPYHQWWIVQESYAFYHPGTSSYQVGHSPRENFNSRIQLNEDQVWIYNAETSNDSYNAYGAHREHTVSSWFIDTIHGSRENAASAITMWLHDVSGFHYWAAVGGFNDTSWEKPDCSYRNHNGDGFVFYFGDAKGENLHDIGGINDIVLESLRLKIWRWGMNVLEYATLLEKAGKKSAADAQIRKMLTYSESKGSSWGSVSQWVQAKAEMAAQLHERTTQQ